jgi:hypothetical protein
LGSSSAAAHISENHQHLNRTTAMEHKIEARKAHESELYFQYTAWFCYLETLPQSSPHVDVHQATVDVMMAWKEVKRIRKLISYHTSWRYLTEELLEHFEREVFIVL